MTTKDLLKTAITAIDEKHAEDILILNMHGVSLVADYFVICHGNSGKQVHAIARELKEKVHAQGFEVKRVEGFDEARWVLIDLGDVVVHIFHRDDRHYYSLERLWGDAKVESVDPVIAE